MSNDTVGVGGNRGRVGACIIQPAWRTGGGWGGGRSGDVNVVLPSQLELSEISYQDQKHIVVFLPGIDLNKQNWTMGYDTITRIGSGQQHF